MCSTLSPLILKGKGKSCFSKLGRCQCRQLSAFRPESDSWHNQTNLTMMLSYPIQQGKPSPAPVLMQADAEVPAAVLQMLDGWFAVAAHSSSGRGPGSSAAASSRSPSRRPQRHIAWSADIPSSPRSPLASRPEAAGEHVNSNVMPRGELLSS